MQNFKEESGIQNNQNGAERTNYAPDTQTPILDPTSQRKAETKIEVCLRDKQYLGIRLLFDDYGLPLPTWLRKRFIINQYRRKALNDNLREAQLDKAFCGKCTNSDEWYDQLHSVWHDINEKPSCI